MNFSLSVVWSCADQPQSFTWSHGPDTRSSTWSPAGLASGPRLGVAAEHEIHICGSSFQSVTPPTLFPSSLYCVHVRSIGLSVEASNQSSTSLSRQHLFLLHLLGCTTNALRGGLSAAIGSPSN